MLSTLYSLNTFSPFLLINSNSAVLCLVAQSYSTLCDPMDCSPPGSSVHEDSPGKNTGAGCHALPCRGSYQIRDGTQVSHNAGRLFTV